MLLNTLLFHVAAQLPMDAHCGGTAAVPILQAAFNNDEAWTVKSMCASFLSKWEEQLAQQILLDEGESHGSSLVERVSG